MLNEQAKQEAGERGQCTTRPEIGSETGVPVNPKCEQATQYLGNDDRDHKRADWFQILPAVFNAELRFVHVQPGAASRERERPIG
jgi:hypothetical protein